jgi:hypothetical protein
MNTIKSDNIFVLSDENDNIILDEHMQVMGFVDMLMANQFCRRHTISKKTIIVSKMKAIEFYYFINQQSKIGFIIKKI